MTVAQGLRDRGMQRALLQFFLPENYFAVRKILLDAGRRDLIGNGCDALIPEHAPHAAIVERRREAERIASKGDHVHSTKRRPGAGYRPGRKSASRR